MNTAASVRLFLILYVVILFFFWFNFTLSVSAFLACEPLFPGGIDCCTLYCLWGKDRRPFSVCQPINFTETTGSQISAGVPQASHNHRSSLLPVCIWSQNSLGFWFHFLPCAEKEAPLSIWGRDQPGNLESKRWSEGLLKISCSPSLSTLDPGRALCCPKFIPIDTLTGGLSHCICSSATKNKQWSSNAKMWARQEQNINHFSTSMVS